jgi:hypothetical protein
MATQTESQVQLEIGLYIAGFQEVAKAGNINSTPGSNLSNYLARQNSWVQYVFQGDYSVAAQQAASNVRGLLNSAVGSGMARSVLAPLLRNYANVSQQFSSANDGPIRTTNPVGILSALYLHFIKQGFNVKSRNITFGTPAAGSNIGSGSVSRLTVDAYGFPIEACHVEAKQARCVANAQTGTPAGEEVFTFQGNTRLLDQINLPASTSAGHTNQTGGSGGGRNFAALSGRNSMLANPSFENFAGTSITSLTSITSWTVGAEGIANYNLDQTNYYRTYLGLQNPASVIFLSAGVLSQASNINNIQFSGNNPYYFQVAYNAQIGAATGTLTLTLGQTSVSVNVSGKIGWQTLKIPLTKMCWSRNFAPATQSATSATLLNMSIQWTGGTGQLRVDEAILAPMFQFDGHWYAILGGQTLFAADNHDTFTWSDTLAGSDSIIQQWLWRSFGMYLPSTLGSPTWADPGV